MALPAALILALCAGAQAPEPPKEAECKALVAEYLALPGGEEGEPRRAEILARLDAAPPLSAAEARTWKKRIAGAQDGEKLDDRVGRHFLADGRYYYVGGKLNHPAGILIHLHGGHTPALENADPNEPFQEGARRIGWACVMPRRIEGETWTDPANERLVLDLLAAALRTWKVGPDRVYLSGSSLGSIEGWLIAARHADRFAGYASFSGGPVLSAGDDVADGVVPNFSDLPVAIFHSTDDPVTPVAASREAARRLGLARDRFGGGYRFRFTEVPGTKHGAPPDGTEGTLAEIALETRDPRPERVVWQPSSPEKRQMYWLRWEHPRPGALVVARLDRARNAVDVRAEGGAAGLEVLLDDELLDLDREVVVTVAGEEAFRGQPERRLAVLLRTGALGDEGLAFEAAVKLER